MKKVMKQMIIKLLTVMAILIIAINLSAVLIDGLIARCVSITLVTIIYAFYAREAEKLILKALEKRYEGARASETKDKWEDMADKAITRGNAIHNQLEDNLADIERVFEMYRTGNNI